MRRWLKEQPKALLGVLLAVDLLFILVHIWADGGRGSLLSLDTDRGLGGYWGFGKAVVAAGLVYTVFRSTQIKVYLVWAVMFATVAIDDLMEVHENGGYHLARHLQLPEFLGLRGDDLGELIVWAMLGAPLLIAVAVNIRRADSRGLYDSAVFFVVMSVLVVVAAGLDAVHMATVEDMWELTPIGVAEDGGEIVVLSFLLTSALASLRSRQDAPSAVPVAVAG